MTLALLRSETLWTCPNCPAEAQTKGPLEPNSVEFHWCAGLRGLYAPMVPAGTRCKVEAVEREDYVGGEIVQLDPTGRPVMSVVTTRDDGTDVVVFAPAARVHGEAM